MVDVLVTSVERGKLARVVERFHVGRDRVEVSQLQFAEPFSF